MNELHTITEQFDINEKITSVEPLGEGFINDTYFVKTTGKSYILQRKNKDIFKYIPGMMQNIEKVSNHLKAKVKNQGGNPERETLTVIKNRNNDLYYKDENGDFWTLCLFIEEHLVFDKADNLELAFAGGQGIGRFQAMLSDFEEPLVDTLPGFHNMRFRFEQWDECLKNDLAKRKDTVEEEIAWVESRRKEMLDFWQLIENGTIPKRVTHNDTKISNILFDKKQNVLCVIDLDTVLNSTVLNDFGDAIRSYTNTGLEDDKELENVSMDIEIFKAYTKGYLSETSVFLSEEERKYLAFSARFITFEQVLRFLMDYINGDTYYKTKYAEHNLVRTRAQYKLLQSIENQMDEMNQFVQNYN